MDLRYRFLVVVAVLGAAAIFGGQGAAAAEFHCSVEPCRYTVKPDGTANSKTAHHVFIIHGLNASKKEVSASFTCGQLASTAESAKKTSTELTLTALEYKECTVISPLEVDTAGCSYLLKASGTVSLNCGTGGSIKMTIRNSGTLFCTVSIPNQSALSGFKYHDAGTTKTELTGEISILTGFTGVTATDGAVNGCESTIGFVGTATRFEYTTGNFIFTGENPSTAVMANVWFE